MTKRTKESVYHEFAADDLLHTVIHAQPTVNATSGTQGWRSNLNGPSGSLSLYGGVRARPDVGPGSTSGIFLAPIDLLDTHSIDKVVFITGSYPATGSMELVKCRTAPNTNFSNFVTGRDWYQEHWRPIELLYSYYSRFNPDYTTSSLDYYSLNFTPNSSFGASNVLFSGSNLNGLSASFTLTAWIKPLSVRSVVQDFTIMSQRARWKLGITGSTGQLMFSDMTGSVTSSFSIASGTWQHVALVIGGGSASFYVNAQAAGGAAFSRSLGAMSGVLLASQSFLTVGAEYVASGSQSSIVASNGFSGFIFETSAWSISRSVSSISGSWNRTMTGALPSQVIHYARFNDGPVGTNHGMAQGSGVFDYGSTFNGNFSNFGLTNAPIWQPNDNVNFFTQKTLIPISSSMLRVLHVPSMFYGRQILTGSLSLTCRAYDALGIVRTLVDDGRGGLYISGSITKQISGEEYAGVNWRKVGNVFYSEGLAVITDPSLTDFGNWNEGNWTQTSDPLSVIFKGDQRINTKVFFCRLGQAQGNCSNNPTFSYIDPSTQRSYAKTSTTYVTSIGLYDQNRNLVAVAKIAQPIRKRGKDQVDVKLKMDF